MVGKRIKNALVPVSLALGSMAGNGVETEVAVIGTEQKRACPQCVYLVTLNAIPVMQCRVKEGVVVAVRAIALFQRFFHLPRPHNWFYEEFSEIKVKAGEYRPRHVLTVKRLAETVFSAVKSLYIAGFLRESELRELSASFVRLLLAEACKPQSAPHSSKVLTALIKSLRPEGTLRKRSADNANTQLSLWEVTEIGNVQSRTIDYVLMQETDAMASPIAVVEMTDCFFQSELRVKKSFYPSLAEGERFTGFVPLNALEMTVSELTRFDAALSYLLYHYMAEVNPMTLCEGLAHIDWAKASEHGPMTPLAAAVFIGKHRTRLRQIERGYGASVLCF